ncbi:MAG: fumarylacetoacetate hydrolase family protein [Acidimicrobiales bacterium]
MTVTAAFNENTLPYGVANGRVVTRLGDAMLPVGDVIADDVFEQPSLNRFMSEGPEAWRSARHALTAFAATASAADLAPLDDVELGLPFEVADYVDFYSSLHHATNLGRLFRPDAEPLFANWRRLPVGYHGRSGTVVASGTPVRRPTGLVQTEAGVERQPTAALDLELEVGFVVGVGSEAARRIDVDDADAHVFGAVLVNDWSARDMQAFEYQPLGPFLGKSFLTSVSAWVVPLDALRPFLVPGPQQEPAPDSALGGERDWAVDLELRVELNGTTVSRNNFADMYWTFAQQLAHLTSNGASTRTGDLIASGTVSGAEPGSYGSLIELTQGGSEPLALADGTRRRFLEDGDTVALRGWCGQGAARVDFGEVVGTVVTERG